MTLKVNDRVKETTSTTGAGTWNLDGLVSGFQAFVAGIGDGDTCPYFAVNLSDITEWETGVGTVTDAAPDTLARSVLTSSNANSLVAFTNPPTVACGFISDVPTMLEVMGAITASSTDVMTNKTLDDDSNNVHAIVTDVRVRNVSGSTITAGQVVYITGYNSGQDRLTIGLADADDAAKMPAIGLAEHDIANNTNGHIVKAGLTENIDTSAFAVGDEIYVSTTAGTLTATKPAGATAAVQKIGLVVRSHASLGRIMVVGSGRENDIPNSMGAYTQTGNVTVDGGITYDGRDVSADGAKLDGIEPAADVTDAANVATSGATMVSDLANTANAAKGDALVGYKRTETGGISRTVHEWMQDQLLNVKDFGATGDGTTDDVTAIQAAFDAVPAAGGAIFFPAGTYQASAAITFTNKPISVSGAGIGVSEVRFTGATGGFDFDFDDITDNLTMHGLTISTTVTAGGDAINGTWPSTASWTSPTCLLYDLEIRPSVFASDRWTNGIVLTEAWNAVLHSIWIRGLDNDRTMENGIILLNASIDVRISKFYIAFCGTGINVGGTCEGTNIDQGIIIFTTSGISMVTAGAEPGTAITNCHINTFEAGIILTNKVQMAITGNLIYKRADSGDAFVGISLTTSSDCLISGNLIRGAGTGGSENGIVVASGSSGNLIQNNHIFDQDAAIVLQAGSSSCIVRGNWREGAGLTIVNSVVSHILSDNTPVDALFVFGVNDTTPSVGGSQIDMFQTDNSGATTITNFDDGRLGQRFSLLANDVNTTIEHNAGLLVRGAVPYAMTNGDVITFRREATNWREESRQP